MNVYDFAADLDLSKEVEGSIFGVKVIEGSDGIVYAKVVSCVDVKDYSCDRCIFHDCYKNKSLLSSSDSLCRWRLGLCVRTGCHRGGVGGALG